MLGDALPKLPFLTMLDQYVYACIFYISFLIGQCCFVSWRHLTARPGSLFILDLTILLLIQLLYIVQRCRFQSRKAGSLATFPFSQYRGGLVALVQFDEKSQGAANVAKVTADEYAHQHMQRDYFEADVPCEWAK